MSDFQNGGGQITVDGGTNTIAVASRVNGGTNTIAQASQVDTADGVTNADAVGQAGTVTTGTSVNNADHVGSAGSVTNAGTVGVNEAPADGKLYGRKDEAWEEVPAPVDITGKMDLVADPVAGELLVQDAQGNAAKGGPIPVIPEIPTSLPPVLRVQTPPVDASGACPADKDFILVATATGSVTMTLPAAAGAVGKVLTFKKMNADNSLIIVPAATPPGIDGPAESITLTQEMAAVTLVCDGLGWWVVNKYLS